MNMLMAVVPRDKADDVVKALVMAGYTATMTDGRGGVLRQAQQILFIVVAAEKLEDALNLIRTNCRTQIRIETDDSLTSQRIAPETVSGTVVFVWDIARVENY